MSLYLVFRRIFAHISQFRRATDAEPLINALVCTHSERIPPRLTARVASRTAARSHLTVDKIALGIVLVSTPGSQRHIQFTPGHKCPNMKTGQ